MEGWASPLRTEMRVQKLCIRWRCWGGGGGREGGRGGGREGGREGRRGKRKGGRELERMEVEER